MENLTAALLIVGGLTLVATTMREGLAQLATAQAFFATVLLVVGVSWIIRGPARPFHGPPLVVLAQIGVSYGAVAAGVSLAFSRQTPKPVQALLGALCISAGVLLLLFRFRVIQPM